MQSETSQNNYYEEYTIPPKARNLERRQVSYYSYIKRFIDVLITILCMPIALILILIFAIIIKLDSRGSAFFAQERVGHNGKYFKVVKLRSMTVDAEKNGAKWAVVNDPRVTKVGRFIRKTRIDELPQLFNVLKGDMSLVGPRPERPMFTAEFDQEIPGFSKRLAVKPGLTGWAQVNGGYDITPKEKLIYDLYYIQNKGFKLDFKILLKTINVVFTGNGAR